MHMCGTWEGFGRGNICVRVRVCGWGGMHARQVWLVLTYASHTFPHLHADGVGVVVRAGALVPRAVHVHVEVVHSLAGVVQDGSLGVVGGGGMGVGGEGLSGEGEGRGEGKGRLPGKGGCQGRGMMGLRWGSEEALGLLPHLPPHTSSPYPLHLTSSPSGSKQSLQTK